MKIYLERSRATNQFVENGTANFRPTGRMKEWTSFKGGPPPPFRNSCSRRINFSNVIISDPSVCTKYYTRFHTHIILITSFSFNAKKVDSTNLVPRAFLFEIQSKKPWERGWNSTTKFPVFFRPSLCFGQTEFEMSTLSK